MDGDSRGYRSAEEQARELTRSIRREVNKLSEQWNALIERSDAWKRKLDDTSNVSILHFYTHNNLFIYKSINLCKSRQITPKFAIIISRSKESEN